MNHARSSAVFLLSILAFPAPRLAAQVPALRGEWVAIEAEVYGARVPDAALPLLRLTFDESGAGWTIPGYPQRFDYTVYGEGEPDSLDLRLPTRENMSWLIPVRSTLHGGDTLDVAFPLAGPFDAAEGHAPPRPTASALRESGAFVRMSLARQPAAPRAATALGNEEVEAAEALVAAGIEQRTKALVAPAMEGRGAGQPGGERAARLVADWYREIGLEPLGDEGFLQAVPMTSGDATPASSLTLGDQTFHVGSDFAIASLPMRTRPATSLVARGEVVLFGPSLGGGLAASPLPTLDVDGKIVAWIASAGPPDGSGADLMRTYEALHRSGAEAIIALFPGPLPDPLLQSPVFSGVTALGIDLYDARPARPVVILGARAFGALFGDGAEVRAFMDGFTDGPPRIQSTGKLVTLSYELAEADTSPTYNVAGVIRGSDPTLRNEAVVYTAHHDAFGVQGGDVHPGAADNALGVAEMVEIARAVRDAGVRPRRSLVFLAVGAEERGMLGALFWTRHPTWPLDRVVANINLDGGDTEAWGPLHGVIDLTRDAALSEVAAEIGAAMGFPLLPNDGPAGGNSDFYDFRRAGIPSIQLMGIGGDPALSQMRLRRYEDERVHQPGDVVDEGWDWSGPRQMAQLYLLLGLRLANADERPGVRGASPGTTGSRPGRQ